MKIKLISHFENPRCVQLLLLIIFLLRSGIYCDSAQMLFLPGQHPVGKNMSGAGRHISAYVSVSMCVNA